MGLAPTLVRGEQHTRRPRWADARYANTSRGASTKRLYQPIPADRIAAPAGKGCIARPTGVALQTASVRDFQNTTSAEAITLTLAVHS